MKRLLRLLFRGLFFILYRVKLTGFDNFPQTPHIIAPNHRSVLDAPLLVAFLPMEFSAIGKASLDRHRLLGPLFRLYRGIPVERDGTDLKAIRLAVDALRTHPLIIFPEGTTTKGRGRIEGKAGLALIAKQADVPIVPVTIKTEYRLFGPIELIVHEPVRVSDFGFERYSSKAYRAIGERVLDIIYQPIDGDTI